MEVQPAGEGGGKQYPRMLENLGQEVTKASIYVNTIFAIPQAWGGQGMARRERRGRACGRSGRGEVGIPGVCSVPGEPLRCSPRPWLREGSAEWPVS